MKKVLCVCTANRGRSPMLEGTFREELRNRERSDVMVESAGILERTVGMPACDPGIDCMKEVGVDISGHKARHISSLDLDHDLFVCVEQNHADELVKAGVDASKTRVLHLPDPHPSTDPVLYRQTREVIEKEVQRILDTDLS